MRTLALAAALTTLACRPSDATTPPQHPPASAESDELPDRDPALAKRLVEEEGAVLLDVRTPEEYAEGAIEGAVNIPHDQIQAQLAQLEALTGGDKSKAIVVYCGSGGRAGEAKASLQAAGYSRVTNVGGMSDVQTE